MSNTILNEDLLDEDLQAVMSPGRCQPNWRPEPKKIIEAKPAEEKKLTGKDKPINAQWELVKPDPDWLDRLKSAAKWMLPWSALCLLVFYWQQAGLMDSAAAVPSMCFCTLMAGFGAGKYAINK